jgi:hypothetical protein
MWSVANADGITVVYFVLQNEVSGAQTIDPDCDGAQLEWQKSEVQQSERLLRAAHPRVSPQETDKPKPVSLSHHTFYFVI